VRNKQLQSHFIREYANFQTVQILRYINSSHWRDSSLSSSIEYIGSRRSEVLGSENIEVLTANSNLNCLCVNQFQPNLCHHLKLQSPKIEDDDH
jgi:hypothetical protein